MKSNIIKKSNHSKKMKKAKLARSYCLKENFIKKKKEKVIIKMVFCARKGGKKMYCRVIVDIVHENVAKPFTYRIPEGMTLAAGQRVSVPFGRMEKEGVITEITSECDIPPEKLRDFIRPLEDFAAIPPELMALAAEMSAKSHCPPAETLRLMLP